MLSNAERQRTTSASPIASHVHTSTQNPDISSDPWIDEVHVNRFSRRALQLSSILLAIFLATSALPIHAANAGGGQSRTSHPKKEAGFDFRNGAYQLLFSRKAGALIIRKNGVGNALAVSEIAGSRSTNALAHVSRIDVAPLDNWAILTGRLSWCRFTIAVTFRNGIVHVRLSLKASADPPLGPVAPDVTTIRASSLKAYKEPLVTIAQATPVAGSSVYVADKGMHTSALYFENFSALGPYFDATQSDPTQGSFSYPNASTESPVGVSGWQFGYELPGAGLISLPLHQTFTVIDSYIALGSIPVGQSQAAQQYLAETDAIVGLVGRPTEPTPAWKSIAVREIGDLANGQNWDSAAGHQYLKSYVSDQRVSPELIAQLSVLLGLREFTAHVSGQHPAATKMIATLDGGLPGFYNSFCGTVTNSLAVGSPSDTEESWYDVTNLISLLHLAQLGDGVARHELLASTPTIIKVARKVHYLFPMQIECPSLLTSGPPQKDVAGGYSYLMLGLYKMTHRSEYLKEAQASITKLLGYGFFLSYEVHMTAYGAAAAEMLWQMSKHTIYRRVATVALANFFNSVRLWDCNYGYCAHSRYHTYMGVNPLPWSDYIAMREQYESWLAMSAFLSAAGAHGSKTPKSELDLARRFVEATPLTMAYSLPTMLPKGAAAATPGAYPFVPRNKLGWDIPLEDLREGLATSGTIGQEIYGAGGPLIFAALTKSPK